MAYKGDAAFDSIRAHIKSHQHEINSIIGELSELIEPFDRLDLAAACGGLQLHLTNANRLVRFHAFAQAVTCLSSGVVDKPNISISRLASVLSAPPIQGSILHRMEDPFSGAYVTETAFYRGGYLAAGGVTENDHFPLQVSLQVLFQSTDESLAELQEEIYPTVMAALALSDAACREAGLRRGDLRGDVKSSAEIPNASRLSDLKRAVTFSPKRLNHILEGLGLDRRALTPLLLRSGDGEVGGFQIQDGVLFTRPFLEVTDNVVLLCPTVLLYALQRFVLGVVDRLGRRSWLNEAFHDSVVQHTLMHLRLLGMNLQTEVARERSVVTPTSALHVMFDVQHIGYVVITTEDLTTTGTSDASSSGVRPLDAIPFSQLLRRLDGEAARIAGKGGAHFGIVSLQGLQRSMELSLDTRLVAQGSLPLFVSAHHLELVASLDSADSTTLWKYCRVKRAASQDREIFGWGFGEEFGAYLKHSESFYLSDEMTAQTSLSLGVGFYDELCHRVTEKVDPRTVPSFAKGIHTRAVLVHGSRDIPIYGSLAQIHGRRGHYLEIGRAIVWTIHAEDAPESILEVQNKFVEMVSFWLWRCSAELASWFRSPLEHPIVLEILCDPAGDWAALRDSQETFPEGSVTTVHPEGGRYSAIKLTADAIAGFVGSSNRGERALMALVLKAICKQTALALISADDIHSVIDKCMPLGRGKQMMVVPTATQVSIFVGRPTSVRSVSRAETGLLLDEIAQYLREEKGQKPGPIPIAKRSDLYRDVVSYLFGRLEAEVAEYSSDGLLEFIIEQHERIVGRREGRPIHDPPRVACFGTGVRDAILEEISRENEAAVASRFLVEYVAARPPSGTKLIGACRYDRLLAICNLIFCYGTESDFGHFRLADIPVRILPSGRLRSDKDAFEAARKRFSEIVHGQRIQLDERKFDAYWQTSGPSDIGTTPADEEWDRAARAEFGATIPEILDFVTAAAAMAHETESGVLRIAEPSFCEQISRDLEVLAATAESLLTLLSLDQRSDFLRPPSPHRRRDVEPWNFNRSLSYMRRPFVRHQGEVVFGVRHLLAFGGFFAHACASGRLRPESGEMKRLLTRIKTEDARAFETRTCQNLQALEGWVARVRVKKVPGVSENLSSFGDIDVVGVDLPRRRLYVIECKDFEGARTASELSWEVSALLRGSASERSTVEKHSDRVAWVRRNLSAVLKLMGVVGTKDRWSVEGVIITSCELMTAHVADSPIPIQSLDQFCLMRRKYRTPRPPR